MNRESAVARIFLYNWPLYCASWAGAVLVALFASRLPHALAALSLTGALFAVAWSVSSLAASHYIYDCSELSGGTWLRPLLPPRMDRWIAIDAGLDAEIELEGALPGRCLTRFDIFDPETMRAGSIRRARVRTGRVREAIAAIPTALPGADESCDAILVVFTAHELVDPVVRGQFFAELVRVLRSGGRVLLVEHVRDLANFAIFGPGALHFYSRSEWLRLAREAGLTLAAERRVTPWVIAFALEKP